MFWDKKTPSEIKQDVIEENRKNGRQAEREVKLKYNLRGYSMERKHTGEDFVARKRKYVITGPVVRTKHIEVKSGNSDLTDLQKKMKKKKSNYKIEKHDPWF